MVAPYEVVQTRCPWGSFAPARAWLLGYVRADAPGYREVTVDGGLTTAPSGEYRFDQYIGGIAAGGKAYSDNAYGCTYFDSVAALDFPDRLGWLMGFGMEAGLGVSPPLNDGDGTLYTDLFAAPFVSPAHIPLIGATWTQVTDEADRRQTLDRHRRNQGYVWGGAAVWRARLTMHRYALEALKIGWCLRGKVTLGYADMLDTPISSAEPRGAITGYALGLDSVSWLDPIQSRARVEYSLVSEPL